MGIDKIISRLSEALGGIERLRGLRSVYSSASISVGGMEGLCEQWVQMGSLPRQRVLVSLDEGRFTQLTVCDGLNAWEAGLDGRIAALGGSDLTTELNELFRASYCYVIPGRMAAKLEFLGEDDAGGDFVISAALACGGVMKWYLDKNTFLPTRCEEPDADRVRTIYFDDWRSVDGVMFPFLKRISTGESCFDCVIETKEVTLDHPLADIDFGRPADPAPDWQFADGQSSCRMPFEIFNNHIYLQLRINNRPDSFWFLLDSGAAGSLINTALADAIGLDAQGKLEARGVGSSSVSAGLITGVSVHLPGLDIYNQTLAVMDMDEIARNEGRPIDGILGYEYFDRFVIEIDYAVRQVTFHEASDYVPGGDGNSADHKSYTQPLVMQGRVPYIDAEISLPEDRRIAGLFIIDTGSRGSLMLNSTFGVRHKMHKPDQELSVIGFGAGGAAYGEICDLDRLRIGQLELDSPAAVLVGNSAGVLASDNHSGNIGGGILRRFRIVFNYSRQYMTFEPNEDLYTAYTAYTAYSAYSPYSVDVSGLWLSAEGADYRRYTVRYVTESSPAARAQLQVGDVILRIDAQNTCELTMEQLRQRLATPADGIQLLVQRGDDELPILLRTYGS